MFRILNGLRNLHVSYSGLVKHEVSLMKQQRNFSVSACRNDLMEFFDDPKHWGASTVKSGRSWKLEELRLKSNVDLHKLWYVLLKERNMLMTMEEEAKRIWVSMASPERLDKVLDSMDNIEAIVRERNAAYWNLEVGETGERPIGRTQSTIGLMCNTKLSQHTIPKKINVRFREKWPTHKRDAISKEFLIKYGSKFFKSKRKQHSRNVGQVLSALKRFPNVSDETLQHNYPDVNLKVLRRCNNYRGDYVQPYLKIKGN